jgi:rhomboid protease GluP
MPNLRMCPHCRAFVPTSERVCTECHEPLGRTYAQRVAQGVALAGLVPPTHFTTLIILLVNFGLFAATALVSTQQTGHGIGSVDIRVLYAFGAKESASILAGGQWWRLVTAGFLHGGLFHILMNSWVLYDLGGQTEQAFGTARFLVIYLISSVMGFLVSSFWTRAVSIGASAALFGLIGAMIAFGYRNRLSGMGSAVKSMYTRWAIYGLLFSLIPGIDMSAHIGGLASGFVVGYLADAGRYHETLDWLWRAAAAAALAVTAISFVFVYLNFPSGG